MGKWMAAGSPLTTCHFASSVQAFGNYRGAAPNQTITDRDFTGQPQNRAVELLYYQARFYVPGIGRFASADTLVPDHKNPQQFNRYTYALNNTLKYVDPTGHYIILPSCWLCKVEIDISQWSSLSVNVASGVCLVAGCHVNREEGTLTGPTQQEVIDSSLLNMAGPLGMVSLPATQAGRNIVGKTLGEAFERAADFGIQTFRKLGQDLGVGSGLQRHHIIEQRFARELGIANTDDMLSVALTREEHQRFTTYCLIINCYRRGSGCLIIGVTLVAARACANCHRFGGVTALDSAADTGAASAICRQ
jgi:RHS repeat-associated protein